MWNFAISKDGCPSSLVHRACYQNCRHCNPRRRMKTTQRCDRYEAILLHHAYPCILSKWVSTPRQSISVNLDIDLIFLTSDVDLILCADMKIFLRISSSSYTYYLFSIFLENAYLEIPWLQIMYGISGSCKPGEVLALMGPSGSSKTSVLSVVGGRTPE